MDAAEELVEVGGFVEGVDDVGDDLALGFHAVEIGDVEEADDDRLRCGVVEVIAGGGFEPAPGAVFALEAAAVFRWARRSAEILKAGGAAAAGASSG